MRDLYENEILKNWLLDGVGGEMPMVYKLLELLHAEWPQLNWQTKIAHDRETWRGCKAWAGHPLCNSGSVEIRAEYLALEDKLLIAHKKRGNPENTISEVYERKNHKDREL